jgi:hypothetical protein
MKLWVLSALLVCSAVVDAQTFGSIIGTARDASGAVIPKVLVTVTNEATNTGASEATNDAGAYAFTTLPPGLYRVRAELMGFRPVEINGIQLQVNQVARYDLAMQVGQVSERVEVSARLATLATDTSDVGQVINNREIVDLPLNGRQYLQLASLTNGVVTTGGAGGDSAGPNFVSQGNRAASNSFLVGGIDTRIQRNNTYGLSISVDAIGEFKIMQNAFAAEYGRGASIIAATIKSGTNELHGTLFEFVRNDKFDARYSYNFGRKTPLRQNIFGASFGGPIIRNKAFFFTNWEGERIRQSNIALVNQVTPAMFGGDLTGTAVARDPDNGTPFPGNRVPAARISQFARAAQKYFLTPSGSPLPNFNHTGITGTRRRADQGTVKVDYNFTDKIRVDGFLSTYDREDFSPGINPYTGDLSTMRTLPVFGVQYTHVFSPTVLNNLRFGRYKSKIYRGQEASTPANVTAEEFGLKNVRPESFAYAPPGMNIATFQRGGAADWQPTGATDRNDQLNESITLTKGRHTTKFGADVRWLQYDDLGWAIQNGTYTFNGQYTGNPVADLLVGIPSFAQIALRGLGKFSYETRHGEYSFFAQDDFKVSPELTINYGIRYELVQFPLEKNNEFANWNFEKFTMLFAGKDLPRRILPMDRNNFGPRVGAAYNPRWSRKTVLRGGFAIMYGNFRQYEAGLQHFHPPYVNENFIANDLPRPSFTTATLWSPPVTNLVGADFSGTTVNYLRDKVMPQIYQFNVNIQRELPMNLLLQVGYSASRGRALPNRYDANQAVQFNPAVPRTINDRRPFQRLGFVSANTSQTYSSYNALDVHLERRFSSGFAIIANYTFMKQLGIRSFDNYTVMMIDNIRHNYGPEGSPHRSVTSYIYELPFGPGKRFLAGSGAVLGRVVGGWQVNGITTFHRGNFLNTSTNVNNGVGSRAGNKADATGQPAQIARDQRTRVRWFNTAAFADPPFTRYGTSGEGVVVGPGAINFDLSVFKNTRIVENKMLQFRWEMFNSFNNVNLGNPNMNVSDRVRFGTINSAAAARIMQFGMKFLF